MSVERCKAELPLPDLWRRLGLRGEPKRSMHSPFRDDKNPSFSVFQKEGKWFFKDHAVAEEKGDEVDLIRLARNCEVKEAIAEYHKLANVDPRGGDQVPRARASASAGSQSVRNGDAAAAASKAPAKPRNTSYRPNWEQEVGEMEMVYDYLDAAGEMLHQTIRLKPHDPTKTKTFRQRRRPVADEAPADDGFVYFMEGIEPVLYRLPEILAASETEPIFFVEGEKDAETLRELGLLSTTVPMGSNKWRESYSVSLRGKWVVVLGDNDGEKSKFAGQKHVEMLCEKLVDECGRLGVIDLLKRWPACPEKGDVSDWWEHVCGSPGEIGLSDSCTRGELVRAARERLKTWANEAELPPAVVAQQIFSLSPQGKISINLRKAAKYMLRHKDLIYAGEEWWKWDGAVWRLLRIQREIKTLIADTLENLNPDASAVITQNLLEGIEQLMMNMSAMHPDQFNRHDPNLINVANGMLRVFPEPTLVPHRRDFFSTVQIPHRYNPHAVCPRFLEWLGEMLPAEDLREQMQEIFGYCLSSGLNYHKFFFFYGDGGTGKSTCADVLARLVGEQNRVAVRLQDLDNAFNRAQLVGKRLYLVSELSRDSLKHMDLVKSITSGDPIHVEKKHKDGYTYQPQGKFVMTSNVRAATGDTTDGFFRRLCQVTFENKIPEEKKDFQLMSKLDAEMEGILFWSLEGLVRLQERGRFLETAASKKAAAELKEHRASAVAFFEQCVSEKGLDGAPLSLDSHCLSTEELFSKYGEWCQWKAVNPYYQTADKLGQELCNRFPWLGERRKRKSNYMGCGSKRVVYLGLQFRRNPEMEGE